MGCCFSSPTTQPAAAQTAPATYAAAVVSAAAQAVTTYLDPSAQHAPQPPQKPTSDKVKQIIPNARVTKIPDGDTFTCVYTNPSTSVETTARIRIMAIDCPETNQNYGPQATAHARSLLENTFVTLHVHNTDRYGRTVADVILPSGVNFGLEMLSAGSAWHYKAYDKRAEYADMEQTARDEKRGLWAYARPQPPWDYRRRQRQR